MMYPADNNGSHLLGIQTQVLFNEELADDSDSSFGINFADSEGDGHPVWNLISVEKDVPSSSVLEDVDPTAQNSTSLSHVQRVDFGSYINDMSMATSPTLSMTPNYDLALRSFIRKPAIKGGALTTSMLMLRLLTTYPLMLRDPHSPPPFIHPSFLADQESKTMESLTTCVSLIQMLESGGSAGRRLVWKNIRLECERLQLQWSDLDAWELLSSMQALLAYMLLRLDEGETEHNNFDTLLLTTAWVIGCAMNCKIGNFNCTSPTGMSYGTTYRDWVFEESRRRTSLTFSIMRMLFSTEPAGACFMTDGFILAPLPAQKHLWEARDEFEWTKAKRQDTRGDSVFGIKVGGRMAKVDPCPILDEGNGTSMEHVPDDVQSSVNWQEWCAGMDGLGALVMLAASLPV
ncbi:hypothetical protein HBH46_188330 [Parastagonospora nodorum]|nr:hypothetical protein HBH46_188330 [Parastagonospora nodorum]KAH4987135.1 hypothetical protein HBI76_107050 [Parastagonospora nodorum]